MGEEPQHDCFRCHVGAALQKQVSNCSLVASGLARNFGSERSWNCYFKSNTYTGKQLHQPVTFQVWLIPPLQIESLGIFSQPQYLLQSITWLHSTEAFSKKKQLWGGILV